MQIFDRERARLDERSVFFDFDTSSLLPGQLPAIEDHAKLAQKYVNDQIRLEGNCDERGGREYNLALGQRRADAVKERLVSLGVVASRISTVSFGKEKPRSLCHEESCWSQNRRADFVDTWK
jgi:peptidoglycan-associated lipoprotein